MKACFTTVLNNSKSSNSACGDSCARMHTNKARKTNKKDGKIRKFIMKVNEMVLKQECKIQPL